MQTYLLRLRLKLRLRGDLHKEKTAGEHKDISFFNEAPHHLTSTIDYLKQPFVVANKNQR